MHIERIEISGFKGISSLEFEPGRLNLITGANNSGKTSLLEAIELAFDPTKVEKYGERVEDLVNANHKDCRISVDYVKEGNWRSEYLDISTVSTDPETLPTKIGRSIGTSSIVSYLENQIDSSTPTDRDKIRQLTRTSVEKSIIENQDAILDLDFQLVKMESDNIRYEYIHFPDKDKIVSRILDTLVEKLSNSLTNSVGLEEEDVVSMDLKIVLHSLVSSELAGGLFLGMGPYSMVDLSIYNRKPKETEQMIDLSRENAAVRLSDIEDYLKDHDLVENLDTLSLDQMVYEEDGEKYQVPYEFTGDGFKTLLGLLWELSGDDDEILLLEEPENHMHPRYIHEFVYWLVGVVEDQDVQMFLTTHDIDFIRSFFDFVDAPRKQFLSENFRLLKMDQTMPEVYDYDDAEELSKELQVDLRGI